jgi:hypothetical protein
MAKFLSIAANQFHYIILPLLSATSISYRRHTVMS